METLTEYQVINKKIRPVLRQMNLYDKKLFPIEKAERVRVTASNVAIAFNLKFKTKLNRKNGTIEVTRIS
ncbi:MAG: hypothetical protein PHZ28_05395 [Candidatus Izemoplasmatales bacterium]|nr:hypothetical protein [Candidatus Izemoplasmatales bacterium]